MWRESIANEDEVADTIRVIEQRLTMACTRPELAWMPFARLDASLNSSRRVMPGVMLLPDGIVKTKVKQHE